MRVFLFRAIGTAVTACLLLAGLSCARDQQLVSIDVLPTVETFGDSTVPVPLDAGLSVQLRALGHYIHPPVTKDITNEVVWGTNDPQMVIVNSTGLITATGGACGGSLISATVQTNSSSGNRTSNGAIVTGSMQANVVCFTGTGGGGSSPLLTVSITSGTGTVTSTPSGITCPGSCSAAFVSGTPLTLTATPTAPSTNVSWSGCNPSGLSCTITITSNSAVTASFF
jgi:hypothetical protein